MFILGTCFFTPLIGGFLADILLGRYNTIYGCSLLDTVGTILLTATTYSYPLAYAPSMSSKEGFLGVPLILIAIGAGGIKANLSPMGAGQVKEQGELMVQKFFDWFYWLIQVGALLAFTIVVYVQQEVSFFYGYLITVVSMTFVTILLLIGRKSYKKLRIIGKGLKNYFFCKRRSSALMSHWLDGAKVSKGRTFSEEMVEDVKSVVQLIPIFVTFVFYWTIYGQVRRTLL